MVEHEDRTQEAIEADLQALRRVTRLDVPSLQDTARTLPASPSGRVRPRWLLAPAGLAMVLLFVPVTYPTAAGNEVVLVIPAGLDASVRDAIARGLRAGLDGEPVRIEESNLQTALHTLVRRRSTRDTRAGASIFASLLRKAGIATSVSVSPRTLSGRGNVYALVNERLRRFLVDVQGRSGSEIEHEVRARLEAAGFRDASVTVERDGSRTSVGIRATDPEGGALETELRHEWRGDARQAPAMEIELPDLRDLEHLPLEERRTAVEKRLRALGIDASVTIDGDRLQIESEKTEKAP